MAKVTTGLKAVGECQSGMCKCSRYESARLMVVGRNVWLGGGQCEREVSGRFGEDEAGSLDQALGAWSLVASFYD